MKLFQRLIVILVALTLLTSLTLWILTQSIHPDTVKSFVTSQLTALTNKPSQITGQIAWQLFPRPGLQVKGIQVGNKETNQDYTLSMDQLVFNLQLMPLLSGKLVFGEVNINGLKMDIQNEDNRPQTQPNKPLNNKPTTATNRFAIDRFVLTHGQISIAQTNQNIKFSDLQMGFEKANLDRKPFPLYLKGLVTANHGTHSLKTSLNFKGRVSLPASLLSQLEKSLPQVKLEGQLAMSDTRINELKIDKTSANVQTENAVLILNPLTLNWYDGQSVGDLHWQLNKHSLELNQTATNLHGDHLLHDLTGYHLVKGKLDYSIHLNLPMKNDIVSEMTGKGHLTMKDGSLLNVNIPLLIEQTRAKLNGFLLSDNPIKTLLQPEQFDKENPTGHTPFKLASIQYYIKNNQLTADSMILQTDRLQITGEGQLNLQDYAIQSRLQATVASKDSDDNLQVIQKMLGGSYPFYVNGTLYKPLFMPDLKVINAAINQLFIKKTLGRPVKLLGDPLKAILD